MTTARPKVILITGCSSGIGRATAVRLAAHGHTVYATARRYESVAELQQWAASGGDNARAGHLDVTDPVSAADIVRRVRTECGRLDVLVNNAGFGQAGAVEDIPLDRWRLQFEVNLFGLIGLTQAALPLMRSAGQGRIINVSSVVAHFTSPFMGAYAATKHALEAVSNALRMEVRPWNIDVVLIEPGPIATAFRENVLKNTGDADQAMQSPYARAYAIMMKASSAWHRANGVPADDVARSIERAVESPRPRARYRITAIARWVPPLSSWMPARLLDALTLRAMGLHRIGQGPRRSKREGTDPPGTNQDSGCPRVKK
jgi:NAD(P)-dependent dehydrogenase (short-subunit alcohol dehydrogenase family)